MSAGVGGQRGLGRLWVLPREEHARASHSSEHWAVGVFGVDACSTGCCLEEGIGGRSGCVSPFPQGNAVPWWDLRGTEPLGLGGTKWGSIPRQAKGEEESEVNASAWMRG